jgi:tetratricopeptide (TPR) repeat protein
MRDLLVRIDRARWRLVAGGVVLFLVIASANLVGDVFQALVWRVPGVDKALHWIEYTGVFTILYWIVGSRVSGPSRAWAAAVMTVGIGLVDEGLQGFVATRTVDIGDLAVNACGVGSGLLWVCAGPRAFRLAATMPLLASLALAAYENHRYADYYAGLRLERVHDVVGARDHYRRAVASGLDSPGLLNALAWTEVESGSGRPAAAVRLAGRALAAQPDNADILDTYGWALHAVGRSAEALPFLERAHAKKPTMYCINLHLGVVQHALGHDVEAARFLRTQIAGRPGSQEAARAAVLLAHLEQPRAMPR